MEICSGQSLVVKSLNIIALLIRIQLKHQTPSRNPLQNPLSQINLAFMKVGFVQIHPEFGQIEKNVARAMSLMSSHPADLYVLPELFATGYVFISRGEAMDFAESPKSGYTILALNDFARSHHAGIVFGFVEKAADGLFNSCAFVDDINAPVIYRKLHLFYKEKLIFDPGNGQLKIVHFRDARIGMMVCFDWIFPEVSRNLMLKGAQLICHPANLVLPFCQQAMITRSLENRVFTITANRIGEENRGGQECKFTGQSQITDCRGNVLYRSSPDKEEVFTADINVEDADDKNVNEFNNIWKDRRIDFLAAEEN
jgi:predicted amidohydrolase